VAEQGCLLSSYPDKIGIGGSNPPLSAIMVLPNKNKLSHRVRRGWPRNGRGINPC
jgi:hypothetical protein